MLIDIIFIMALILACLKGLRKGLIVAVFSIIAFIIGLAAALKLSAVVAGYMKDSVHVSAKWLPVLSFALVFFGVVLLVNWGGKLVERTFQVAMLGWANKIAGAALYAVLYIIILSIFLFYAEKINLLEPSVIHSSVSYAFIQPWGPVVIDNFGKLIPIFKNTFDDLSGFFGSLPGKIQ